jgi:hypothetical protein
MYTLVFYGLWCLSTFTLQTHSKESGEIETHLMNIRLGLCVLQKLLKLPVTPWYPLAFTPSYLLFFLLIFLLHQSIQVLPLHLLLLPLFITLFIYLFLFLLLPTFVLLFSSPPSAFASSCL